MLEVELFLELLLELELMIEKYINARVRAPSDRLSVFVIRIEPSKSVLYIAINCRWEEAQPILAHDDLQFACWKMMDYKMDCRKGS